MTWREKWRAFRKWDSKGLLVKEVTGSLGRTTSGYVIDRRIFRTYGGLLLALLLYVGLTSGVGWREEYVRCPPDPMGGPCDNPYYLSCDATWCAPIANSPTIARGTEYGTPPDPRFAQQVRGLWIFALSGMVVAFGVNHLVHNRMRKFSDILPPTNDEEEDER